VTATAASAETVLLDTSVIVNFADAGMLIPLAQYLSSRATITLDVDRELRRLAGTSRPELATLDRLKWPAREPIGLPPALLADADSLRKLHRGQGQHEAANAGEISTTLAARIVPNALVVMDDRLGVELCRFRKIPRISTAQLAAEMVAAEALDAEAGFAVYDIATPDGVGRAEFAAALARAREASAG
jgi:hypothetical protein